MSHSNRTNKIIRDLTLWQVIWAAFYFAAIIVFFFITRFFSNNESDLTRPFLDFTLQSNSGFMLILGLISVPGFLAFMVKQGVTRRAYFIGTAVSSLIITVTLIAMGTIIQYIVQSLMTGTDWQPVFSYESSMLKALPVILIQLYLFYLLGWMIGATFYRFGVLGGMISIAGALALLMGVSYLIDADNSLPSTLISHIGLPSVNGEIPFVFSLLILLLISALLLAVIRLMTKRVRIKIK